MRQRTQPPRHRTPEAIQPLTSLEKWTYSIGNIPFAVSQVAFGSFVVFFYTQVRGLSGTP